MAFVDDVIIQEMKFDDLLYNLDADLGLLEHDGWCAETRERMLYDSSVKWYVQEREPQDEVDVEIAAEDMSHEPVRFPSDLFRGS